MRIKETYVGYTGEVNVGRFAFFIQVEDDGVEFDIEDLVAQAVHFPRVVLKGTEVFEQKDEVAKFITKCKRKNPKIIFEIFTKGTVRPIKVGSFSDIIYNVEVQLSNSGVHYDKRIKPVVLRWFVEIDANFLFYVINEEYVDETNLIVQEYAISKSKVFLGIAGSCGEYELNMIMRNARRLGYNFTLQYGEMFWRDYGTKENNTHDTI